MKPYRDVACLIRRAGRYGMIPISGAFYSVRTFEQLMALPVPEMALDEDAGRMVQWHLSYWQAGADDDNEVMPGYPMYELCGVVLPTRYLYLRDQLMNYSETPESMRRVLRAIIGLAGPDVDWEPYLHGY